MAHFRVGLKNTAFLATVAVCACQNVGGSISEAQAVQIASKKLTTDFPRMNLGSMRRLASKSGNAWVVTYFPNADALGGPTTVVVDNRSGEVIVVLGSQ